MAKHWFWLLWALAPWTWAHDAHNPHEHGVIYVDLVSENQVLDVLLRAPLASLVGFEHTPSTPAEITVLNAALDMLNYPSTWLAQKTCQWQLLESTEQGAAHKEVTRHYRAFCAPHALNFHALFERFRDLEQLKLQLLTAKGQVALTLTADHPLVELN